MNMVFQSLSKLWLTTINDPSVLGDSQITTVMVELFYFTLSYSKLFVNYMKSTKRSQLTKDTPISINYKRLQKKNTKLY